MGAGARFATFAEAVSAPQSALGLSALSSHPRGDQEHAVVRRRKIALLSISVLAVVGAILFADWRQWLPWPKLLHHSYASFDQFKIYGKAPWCFLVNAHDDSPDCHYLSETHCQIANPGLFLGKPEDRGLCVPNPRNKRAGAGRVSIVKVAPNDQ